MPPPSPVALGVVDGPCSLLHKLRGAESSIKRSGHSMSFLYDIRLEHTIVCTHTSVLKVFKCIKKIARHRTANPEKGLSTTSSCDSRASAAHVQSLSAPHGEVRRGHVRYQLYHLVEVHISSVRHVKFVPDGRNPPFSFVLHWSKYFISPQYCHLVSNADKKG